MNKVSFGLSEVKVNHDYINGAISATITPVVDDGIIEKYDRLYFAGTKLKGYRVELRISDTDIYKRRNIVKEQAVYEKYITPSETSLVMGHEFEEQRVQGDSHVDYQIPIDSEFTLSFKIKGDQHNRRIVFHRCVAVPGPVEYKTSERQQSLANETFMITVLPVDHYIKYKNREFEDKIRNGADIHVDRFKTVYAEFDEE